MLKVGLGLGNDLSLGADEPFDSRKSNLGIGFRLEPRFAARSYHQRTMEEISFFCDMDRFSGFTNDYAVRIIPLNEFLDRLGLT